MLGLWDSGHSNLPGPKVASKRAYCGHLALSRRCLASLIMDKLPHLWDLQTMVVNPTTPLDPGTKSFSPLP